MIKYYGEKCDHYYYDINDLLYCYKLLKITMLPEIEKKLDKLFKQYKNEFFLNWTSKQNEILWHANKIINEFRHNPVGRPKVKRKRGRPKTSGYD